MAKPNLIVNGESDKDHWSWEDLAKLLGPQVASYLDSSPADEATVWLETPEGGRLRAVCNPVNASLIGFEQPLEAGLISQVFVTGMPLLEKDVRRRHDHDPSVDLLTEKPTRSLLAAPIESGGEIIGVLSAVAFATHEASPPPQANDLEALMDLHGKT